MTLAGTAAAEVRAFRVDYAVTLLGLPVAKASFDSNFQGKSFQIKGRLSSSGIARLFDDTVGTTQVEGIIGNGRVSPRSFSADYISGRKRGKTEIRFANDGVESFVNHPQKKRDPKNWIATSTRHLKAALDPLSANLVIADSAEQVCDRTIRFFDGELRADLKLAPTGSLKDGRVTCTARFIPVAGYRTDRKQIDFLKNRSRIAITFAPLPGTGIYTPVDASVSTQIGTLRIQATHIEMR